MKQVKQDFISPANFNTANTIGNFVKNLQLKQTNQKPAEGSQNKQESTKSVLEKHKEAFKDMPKAFFETVRHFEKNGYQLDKSDLNELKTLFQQDAIDSKSTQFATDKNLPINAQVMSDVKNYLGASLLDFLELSDKKQVEEKKDHTEKTQSFISKTNEWKSNPTANFVGKIDSALEEMLSALDKEANEQNSFRSLNETNSNDPNQGDSNHISDDVFLNSVKELKSALEELSQRASIEENQLLNSAFLSQNYEIKMILEEKITPKIASVREQFNDLKNTLSKNLEMVQNISNPANHTNNAALLAKSIEMLDNAIMKSDISLYMDLKGERDLIKISTQLNSASELLNKGDYQASRDLLSEISSKLNDMVFRPSLKKVMAISNQTPPVLANTDFNTVGEFFKNAVQTFNEGQFEASKLLDYLRSLGINHEAESFQKLFPALSGTSATSQEHTEAKELSNTMRKDLFNLKEVLLSLSKSSENISMGEKVKANSAIGVINANQYQNKLNENKLMQEVSFHIPLTLNEGVADVKVFIKSSQKNMKLDYANFNMYFVINTQAQGNIGIRVSSLDLKLKIEIKNDLLANTPKQMIEDAKTSFKKHVEEIGYSLIELKISKFDQMLSTNPLTDVDNVEVTNSLTLQNTLNLQV